MHIYDKNGSQLYPTYWSTDSERICQKVEQHKGQVNPRHQSPQRPLSNISHLVSGINLDICWPKSIDSQGIAPVNCEL